MADSHIKSNLVAKIGTETISGFATISGTTLSGTTLSGTTITGTGAVSGATVAGTTSVTGASVIATSYIRVGTAKYIFSGAVTETSASIVAAATSLVATPIKGSLYMGVGTIWKFNADTTATKMT